jgi:hypothetical protein
MGMQNYRYIHDREEPPFFDTTVAGENIDVENLFAASPTFILELKTRISPSIETVVEKDCLCMFPRMFPTTHEE